MTELVGLHQADCVLLVVDSKTPPDLSLVEAQLSWAHRYELLCLYSMTVSVVIYDASVVFIQSLTI